MVLAHQILTGWLDFGERANLSRRNLNIQESLVAVGAIWVGLAGLIAAWGLLRRQAFGWAWSQWVAFAGIFIGFGLGASDILGTSQRGAIDWEIVALGALIFLVSVLVYRYTAHEAEMPPDRYFSIQLSNSPSSGAIIGFVFILIGFSMATDLFLNSASIASVLTNNATKGIIAIGITILMISGEFDLSVGSVLGATSMIFMLGMTEGVFGLPTHEISSEGLRVLAAAGVALLFASVLGLINGLVFVWTRIPSFIVTLGTLFAYRAISLVGIAGGRILRYKDYYAEFPQLSIHRGFVIVLALAGLAVVAYVAYRILPAYLSNTLQAWRGRNLPKHYFALLSFLSNGLWLVVNAAVLLLIAVWLVLVVAFHAEQISDPLRVGAFDILNGRISFTLQEITAGTLSISIPNNANFRMAIIWWLVLVFIFQVILVNTRYGNAVFATGGNLNAARAQGINPSRVKVQNFVLCAFLAGVAAIFEVARNPGVDPLKGNTWELEAIAMTVIGGTLLTGGYGSVTGTMLGVMIFGMLQTGLVLVGMDSRMFQGVIGVIMVIAVVLNNATKTQGGLRIGQLFKPLERIFGR